MSVTYEQRLDRDGAVDPILFYDAADPYGEFSNFSPHAVELPDPWEPGIKMRKYRTGEHRYQAMKAIRKEDHDFVARAPGPSIAKQRGNCITLRDDWGDTQGAVCWFAMLETVLAKALQHLDVLDALSATEDKWIYEDSPRDDIWGWRYGHSYSGKNLLGLAWMHTRAILLG